MGMGIKFPQFTRVYITYILPVIIFIIFIINYIVKFS